MGAHAVTAGGRRRAAVRGLAVALIGAGLLLSVPGTGAAQEDRAPGAGAVWVVEVTGEIDLGLAPYLSRALSQAADAAAAAVLVRIDTPGGRLDAVLQMRDALLGSPLRTIAYVDRTAFSAGALVALAANEIHFAPGGVMGAATPVQAGTGIAADEKIISAVRSTFRATAEERGRDPLVAEAMVDPQVLVPDLSPRGQLVTLTVADAQAHGYADGVAPSRTALLDSVGLGDAPIVETAPSPAERLARVVTGSAIAGLLLAGGILLLLGDLLAGGTGVMAAAGAALLALFFWGHLLAGLAGWEDVALVVLGILLLIVELLVLPGFGVPGVLGLIALLGGSFLAMVNRDIDFVTSVQIGRAATTVGLSFLVVIVGTVALLVSGSRRGAPRALVLRSQLARAGAGDGDGERRPVGWLRWFGDGGVLQDDRPTPVAATDPAVPPASVPAPATVPVDPGDTPASAVPSRVTGIALSDLRPAGVAHIDGQRVDVVTEGDYIAAGERIEVLHDEGWRRVVRRAGD